MSYHRQIQRELEFKQEAVVNSYRSAKKTLLITPESVMPKQLQGMIDSLGAEIAYSCDSGKRGRKPCTAKLLAEGIEPKALAYITITTMLASHADSYFAAICGKVAFKINSIYPDTTDKAQAQRLVLDAITVLDVFEYKVVSRGVKGSISTVALTPKGEKLLDSRAMSMSQDATLLRAMLCPPMERTETGGGYLVTPTPFIRSKSYTKLGDSGDVSLALAAVNKLQAVPYRVNRAVYDVLSNLPPIQDLRQGSCLRMAGESLDDVLYFPMNCDFRGRMYYLADLLRPEGEDIARALLMFDESCEIATLEDARWLLIHYCNLWGDDKTPLDDRVQWTLDNIGSDVCWTEGKGKEKYQRLAAKLEVEAVLESLDKGVVYHSHLPVAMDFTCNAYQVIAGILRDESTAKLVNLLPSDNVEDLYTVIGDEAGVSRAFAKDVVMIDGYNATRYGKIQALMDSHACPNAGEVVDKIENALAEVCPAIPEFKRQIIREANDALSIGEGYRYTTPSGWRVAGNYLGTKDVRLETGGIKIVYKEPTNKLSKKNITASVPNTVHALDANVLQELVVRAPECPMVAIHDSISTLARDAEIVRQEAIQSFVRVVANAPYNGCDVGSLDMDECLGSSYMLS